MNPLSIIYLIAAGLIIYLVISILSFRYFLQTCSYDKITDKVGAVSEEIVLVWIAVWSILWPVSMLMTLTIRILVKPIKSR